MDILLFRLVTKNDPPWLLRSGYNLMVLEGRLKNLEASKKKKKEKIGD